MAVGAYNDTIYLIGGKIQSRRATAFNWKTDTFSSIVPNPLIETQVFGYGQFWTQQQHLLYLIALNDQIGMYNLATNVFTSELTAIPVSITRYGCLASQYQHLYVVGGFNSINRSLNQVHILNTETLQWANAPLMNDPRDNSACIVSNDYLWVFAGYWNQLSLHLTTNERIHVPKMMNNSWHYVDPLLEPTTTARCVSWNDVIYIIGGQDSARSLYIVYLMDMESGSIVDFQPLPYPNSQSAPIIANSNLYVFGGWRDHITGDLSSECVYFPLPSSDPSRYPTIVPSPTTASPTTPSPTTPSPTTPSTSAPLLPTLPPTQPLPLRRTTDTEQSHEDNDDDGGMAGTGLFIAGICVGCVVTLTILITLYFCTKCRAALQAQEAILRVSVALEKEKNNENDIDNNSNGKEGFVKEGKRRKMHPDTRNEHVIPGETHGTAGGDYNNSNIADDEFVVQ
eukprot:781017_1